MAEITTRGVLMTDWGQYELPNSVAEKIASYPTVKFKSIYADDDEPPMDVVDLNHPAMARYYRLVSRHMERLYD